MDNSTKLNEAISDGFDYLKGVEKGTESYTKTIDGLVKLMDRDIERTKVEIEHKEKAEAFKSEQCLKVKQMHDDRIDRIIKNSLTALSIGSGIVLTVWGTFKTFKFEETGTITSTPGRKFIGNLFFKK